MSPATRIRVTAFVPAGPGAVDAWPRPAMSPSVRAVLEEVLSAVAASGAEIAAPILDRGVREGAISRRERRELLVELASIRGPSRSAPAMPRSVVAVRLLRESLAAIRRAAPAIALPILTRAVASERLTAAQERRVLAQLEASALRLRLVA